MNGFYLKTKKKKKKCVNPQRWFFKRSLLRNSPPQENVPLKAADKWPILRNVSVELSISGGLEGG